MTLQHIRFTTPPTITETLAKQNSMREARAHRGARGEDAHATHDVQSKSNNNKRDAREETREIEADAQSDGSIAMSKTAVCSGRFTGESPTNNDDVENYPKVGPTEAHSPLQSCSQKRLVADADHSFEDKAHEDTRGIGPPGAQLTPACGIEVTLFSEECTTNPQPENGHTAGITKSKDTKWRLQKETRKAKDRPRNDVIIPVIGPIGSGKSTFINTAVGRPQMEVGHNLKPCTSTIAFASLPKDSTPGNPALEGRRIVLVDTPGFDDTYDNGMEILKRLVAKLTAKYKYDTEIAGIVYLHDISQKRSSDASQKMLQKFREVHGRKDSNNMYLVTTSWELVPESVGHEREDCLKNSYWKPLIDNNAKVMQCWNNPDSVMQVLQAVLSNVVAVDRDSASESGAPGKAATGFSFATYTLKQFMEHLKGWMKGDSASRACQNEPQ